MQDIINGRYKLLREIGSGGMGIVYQAKDRLIGEPVAFKQVLINTDQIIANSISPNDTREALRMGLAKEFQTLASMRHPNIISVLDYGFDAEHQPFYTMTYLSESQTILEAGESCTFDQKINFIEQLLQGLAYLHRRGVLHRDIKPENVLVTDGIVRLLDFGLAQRKEEEGALGGSPLFMAPEILDGREATQATDLYSVGVLLYQLLTGHHPFGDFDAGFYMRLMAFELDLTLVDRRLHQILGHLLTADLAERFQSAGQVLNAFSNSLGRPLLQESEEIRESYLQAAHFVGRQQEMAQLKQPLFMPKREHGFVYLLGGESGVGKSRLLDELRTEALVLGWQVIVGQEVADGGAPYQLWQEIIVRLCLNVELSDLEASILKEVVPFLGQILDRKIAASPNLSASEGEQRLALTITSLLQRQSRPTLLILEDLHWSEESLSPLKQMLKVLDQLPNVFVIGSYRHDERVDLPDELPGSKLVLLERFNDNEIAQLSKAMLGEIKNRTEIVSLLTKETEGNTFFIVEVMRALAEDAGRLTKIGEADLPTGIFTSGMGALLQRRINKVREVDRPLLQLAAVAGKKLDLKLLQALAPEKKIDAWLQEGSEAAVLIVRDDQWFFSHDKLRQAAINQLDRNSLKQAHQQIALQVENLYPEDERTYQALLAHWQAAEDEEKELEYLLPVLRQLVYVRGDFQQGNALATRGLSLSPLTDPQRTELLNLQASICISDGRLDDGELFAQEAFELAKALEDMEGQATSLISLGIIQREQSRYSEADEIFHRAMIISQHADDIVNMATCSLQLGIVAEFQKEYDTAEEYFKQSLSLNQLNNDKIGISNCYFYLGMLAAQYHNDFEKSLEYAQDRLAIFQENGNLRDISSTYTSMGIDYASTGRYETAREYFNKSLAIKKSVGDKPGIAHTYLVLGEAYFFEGIDYAESLKHQEKSLELLLEINLLAMIGIDYGYITLSHFALGSYEKSLNIALDHFRVQSTIECDKSNGLVHTGVAKLLAELEEGDICNGAQEKIDEITGFTQLPATPIAYIEEAVRVSTISQIRMVVLIECGQLAMKIGEMELAIRYLNEAKERAQLAKNQHKLDQIIALLEESAVMV